MIKMGEIGIPSGLGELILEQQHITFIFPEDTNLTVTFTAHANANTWSNWTEIQDNGVPTTLSSKFATHDVHITAVMVEEVSLKDKGYMFEIAYGGTKTIISPHRFISGTAPKEPAIQQVRVRSAKIPGGETVYYRMKCEAAGGNTCEVSFRYHYHS